MKKILLFIFVCLVFITNSYAAVQTFNIYDCYFSLTDGGARNNLSSCKSGDVVYLNILINDQNYTIFPHVGYEVSEKNLDRITVYRIGQNSNYTINNNGSLSGSNLSVATIKFHSITSSIYFSDDILKYTHKLILKYTLGPDDFKYLNNRLAVFIDVYFQYHPSYNEKTFYNFTDLHKTNLQSYSVTISNFVCSTNSGILSNKCDCYNFTSSNYYINNTNYWTLPTNGSFTCPTLSMSASCSKTMQYALGYTLYEYVNNKWNSVYGSTFQYVSSYPTNISSYSSNLAKEFEKMVRRTDNRIYVIALHFFVKNTWDAIVYYKTLYVMSYVPLGYSTLVISNDLKVSGGTATGGNNNYTCSFQSKSAVSNSWSQLSASIPASVSPVYDTRYRCYYTDNTGCGNVTTNEVEIKTNISADINTSTGYLSDGAKVAKGYSFNLGVTNVKGSNNNYTYVWKKDGVVQSGSNGQTISISNIQSSAKYTCTISTSNKSLTKDFNISVYPDLSCSLNNCDKLIYNDSYTLNATISGGSGVYNYVWYQSEDNINWSKISNATTKTLTIVNNESNLTNSKIKYYKIEVNDNCGYSISKSCAIIFYKSLSLNVSFIAEPNFSNDDCYIYNSKISFSEQFSGGIGNRNINYYTSSDNVSFVSNSNLDNFKSINLTEYSSNKLYIKIVVADSEGTTVSKTFSFKNYPLFSVGAFEDQNFTIEPNESIGFDVSSCVSGGSGQYSYQWYYCFTKETNNDLAWHEVSNEYGTKAKGFFTSNRNIFYKCKVTDNITNEFGWIAGYYCIYVKINAGKISLLNDDFKKDTTICYNQKLAFLNNVSPSGGSGDYSYQWYYKEDDMNSYQMLNTSYFDGISPQGLSLGDNIIFKKNTQFYRFVVDKNNSTNYAYSDTIKISVYKPFVVNFPDDKTICFNTVPDTMMVYASGGVGNYTYSWFNLADEVSSSVKIDTLSKTDSLYNWNYLRQGTSLMVGKTPFKVQVFDECASEMGPGYLEKIFYVSMLGKVELSSPNIYSSLDQVLFGKKSIDFDAGSTDSYYVKTNEPIAGSGSFTYKWYFKSINGEWNQGFDNSNSLYHLVNLSTLTDTSLFRYSVSDNICPNDFVLSDSVQFNYISFNKPILNNNQVQQLCYNSIPEPLRMTTRPGVAKYTYSWYKSVDGGQTYSELLGYVGDTLVFADVANNRLTSDALFKVRVQLGTGSNARYLESDPITVQVVSQVNPGQITIGNGGNGSIVDNDTVIYNMTSPLLRNLQSADGGHINASSVSYQWYKKEGAQTIFSPIDGAINADYQPGQVKLTTSYYRAVNDVCASSYSNIVTVNVKNVSISENIGGNNDGNSENGGGNNNGGNNGSGNQGGNNGNNGGNNNGGESNNGTQNYDNSLDLTPDLDYLGDDFVYQGGGIWEKTSGNSPLKKARYCRGSNVNLNLNVDIVGTYIWLDDSDNEIKKGSKFSISNIQNDTIVKAQIYDTEGVLVLEQLYVITVVDAYPEFKASKVHVEAGESVRFTNSTKDLKSALWSFGDGTDVSFADEPWHYFVKPGIFTVTLTAVNKLGCKSTLTKNEYIIVDEYSGAEYTDINNNKSFDVQVFPNPAKDILYVRGEKDLSIKMFSSQGAILFSADDSNDFDIDMSDLSEGVYMLKISDGSWTISRKVIKQ